MVGTSNKITVRSALALARGAPAGRKRCRVDLSVWSATKIQLCDFANANMSAPSITVTAQSFTPSVALLSRSAPAADANFRYDATLGGSGGYRYNVSTKSLVSGSYVVNFTVGAQPFSHGAPFQVR